MHLCEHVCLSVYFLALQEASGLSSIFFPQITTSARSPHVFYWKIVSACWIAQLCPTLCDPMDCSPPGSSVHESLQATVLEWVAMRLSRGSFWSNWHVFCILNWQVGSLSLAPPGKPLENSTRHQNPHAGCVYCYWVVVFFFFFTLSTDRAKNRLPLALCTYIYKHLHMCMLSHSVVSDSLWPDRL